MASTSGKSGNSSSARSNTTHKSSSKANPGLSSSASRGANTSRSSSAVSRASSAGNTRTASRSRSKVKSKQRISLFVLLKSNSVGRFLLIFALTVCILGVDFLISLNHFDIFFLILGIELLLAVLIGWIRFVLRGRIDDEDS